MKYLDSIKETYPELYRYCEKAEAYAKDDSEASLLKAGKALEYMVKNLEKSQLEPVVWIHEHRNDCINELEQHGTIDETFAGELHQLRVLCNDANDERNPEPTEEDAAKAVALLEGLLPKFAKVMPKLATLRKEGPYPEGKKKSVHKKVAKAGGLLALGGMAAAAILTVIFGSKG